MAQQVGDLYPRSSGTSSLGVEMENAGFTTDIRPFGHVHANSGVTHDPLHGISGVVRYARRPETDSKPYPGEYFEFSADGGNEYHIGIGRYREDVGEPPIFWYPAILGLPNTTLHIHGSGLHMGSLDPASLTEIESNGGIRMAAALNTGGVGVSIISNTSDIRLDAGVNSQGGQINLRAFNSSGILEYRMGGIGGHQAWHWKPSYASFGGPNDDGYFPIPHSGQILQMILENAGGGGSLQTAYLAGNDITVSAANGGAVNIAGTDTFGLQLSQTDGSVPHIYVSGHIQTLDGGNSLTAGALWMQQHSAGTQAMLAGASNPTTMPLVRALSLGPGAMFYNTGSGIAQVQIASGISQFFNVSSSAAITEAGLYANLNFQTVDDGYFRVTANSGIRIYVGGCYRIAYTASFEKTAGNLTQNIRTQLRVSDSFGNVKLLGGTESAAIVRDSNTLNVNTSSGASIADIEKNEYINLFMYHNGAPPAGNTTVLQQRAGTIVLEYLGPKRTGKQIRLPASP